LGASLSGLRRRPPPKVSSLKNQAMSAPGATAARALPTLLTSRARLPEVDKSRSGASLVERPLRKLPEVYVLGVHVRNTFIETSMELSPSVETFFREREVSTCPSSHIGRLRGLFEEISLESTDGNNDLQRARDADEAAWDAGVPDGDLEKKEPVVLSLAEALGEPIQPMTIGTGQGRSGCQRAHAQASALACEERYVAACSTLQQHEEVPWCETPTSPAGFLNSCFPKRAGQQMLEAVPDTGAAALPSSVGRAPSSGTPGMLVSSRVQTAPVPAPLQACGAGRPDLAPPHPSSGGERGSEALPVFPAALEPRAVPALPEHPAPGSPELPSLGSAGHAAGDCKPCAFFHTAGCANGLACQFCHLCEPGEKKRRRKEKIEALRAARKSSGAPKQA